MQVNRINASPSFGMVPVQYIAKAPDTVPAIVKSVTSMQQSIPKKPALLQSGCINSKLPKWFYLPKEVLFADDKIKIVSSNVIPTRYPKKLDMYPVYRDTGRKYVDGTWHY